MKYLIIFFSAFLVVACKKEQQQNAQPSVSPDSVKINQDVSVYLGRLNAGEVGIDHHLVARIDDALVIHGERDQVVPLAHVLAWAAPQNLPVSVLGEADHFFHGRLHVLRLLIERWWRATAPAGP